MTSDRDFAIGVMFGLALSVPLWALIWAAVRAFA